MGSGNEILDTYIYEANSLLEQLETIVLDAEKGNTFSEDDVNAIFRIMHTIKGSSAMMEFDTLSTIAHRIEDLFFIIRENGMKVVSAENKPVLFDVLFQSIDYFRGEVEKIEAEEPLSKDIDTFLLNINSLMAKIKGEPAPEGAGPAAAPAPAAAAPAAPAAAPAAPAADSGEEGEYHNPDFPYELRVYFEEGCGMESLRSFMLVTSARDFCMEENMVFYPDDVEKNSESSEYVVNHGFLMMFKNEGDRNTAIPMVEAAGSVHSYDSSNYTPPAPEPPKEEAQPEPAPAEEKKEAPAKKEKDAAPAAKQAGNANRSKESLISVNLSKLDQLSAVVGEIVITEAMVTSSPDLKGLNLDEFTKSARQLRKLTDELQDVSMSLRMVSVSATFQKMNRIVRDMSKKLNKRVKFTLIGENTEIDKTIVDNIGDPIMHMVRNAMDHGIEEHEEDRVAAGKDPVGEVVLSARDTGNEVIIEIKDDGQGVNDAAVLKKAIKNGIASPDIDYSHKEILNFLLAPGFSTNTQVTEFSGRGVGMDVVKRSVEDLGGSVSISSELGKGMTTTMRIPLTTAIMDGMEVSVGKSVFTIPISNILQSFKVSEKDIIHDSARGEVIKLVDHFYPIVRANEFYNLPNGRTNIEDGILLWLESGNCTYCLFVDELIGEQQVVVKQLPEYVNYYNVKEYGINGCTLLGDGSISIILDVAGLYTASQRN